VKPCPYLNDHFILNTIDFTNHSEEIILCNDFFISNAYSHFDFRILSTRTNRIWFHFQLYTPLNIFIALVGVEVWTDADEIHLLNSGDKTLTNFLQYRKERLVKSIPNDNAQLLT
jgi:hypothetical protein